MLRSIICLMILAMTTSSAFADVEVACQAPNYGVAIVDGNYGEWGLNSDFFADMLHRWTGPKVLAKLYLRYDCAENVMYALVLTVDLSRTMETQKSNEAWIKINGAFAVNDTYGAEFFRWIDKVGDRAVGWEAKFSHNLSLCTIQAHSNVWWNGESQTAGTSEISLCTDCPTLGAIGDYVWHDANFNGLQDDGAMNVVGIANITLTLVKLDEAGNALEETTTQTDANGWYLFSNLTAGRYFVDVDERDEDMPSTGGRKWVQTQLTAENKHDPHCVQLADGQVYLQADFGFAGVMDPALGTIGDYTWWDKDDNNLQWHDPNLPDLELPYIIVELFTYPQDVLCARAKTDRYGNYLFYNVPFGEYVVRVDESGPSKPYLVETLSSTVPYGGGLSKRSVPHSEFLKKGNAVAEAPYWEVYNWRFTGAPPYANNHYVQLTSDAPDYLDADFPWLEEDPIAVRLLSFSAEIADRGVCIGWQTVHESGTAGYRLLRRSDQDAEYACVHDQLIAAKGFGSHYEYLDAVQNAGVYFYVIEEVSLDGACARSHAVSISLSSEVAARFAPAIFALYPNHPNPFNPQTTLRFALPHDERVVLAVYDLSGRLVRQLIDGQLPAGEHAVIWDGLDGRGQEAPSGAYLYQLAAGQWAQTRKMVLIR